MSRLEHPEQIPFGTTEAGLPVSMFRMRGSDGLVAEVLTRGAAIRALHVPDRAGVMADVVLGYDELSAYEADRQYYFGAVVGRYAGRIAGGTFGLDGREYALSINAPPNHLHGGFRGFDQAVWSAEAGNGGDGPSLTLTHRSPAGDEGYPGRLEVHVTYTVLPDNVLALELEATADAATPFNPTQHAYFNLAGAGNGDVRGHRVTIEADRFVPLKPSLTPVGTLEAVAGTPFDFRSGATIGERLGLPHEQLRIAGGFDHSFEVRGEQGTLRHAATVTARGRVLQVHTTEPGVHLYTANFLADVRGKEARRYGPHAGVCLETQHYADSPNQPAFPSTTLRPGEMFRSRTEFRFSSL